MSEIPTVQHWVNGAPAAGTSTRTAPVFNPARGVAEKNVLMASTADVDTVVAAAKAALPAWRDMSIAKRQNIMFNFRELLHKRTPELAAILTNEHGKVLSDAAGEIARGLEVVEYACSMPTLMKGDYSENVSTGVDVYSLKQPVGVVGIISPFNFPAMVPLWFFPLAIAAGNTVVLKPSEKDPSAANFMAQMLKDAGLPDGVFNVVHGDKEAV
ncbi:aldehyde dehydrogenase family protein, partial [Microterricola pindariensis]